MDDVETKTCPRCAEDVRAAAKGCKHCGVTFANVDSRGRRQAPWWVIIAVSVVVLILGAIFVQGEMEESERDGHRDACRAAYEATGQRLADC